MQTKTVGVVIPIYNVEKYLKECLDSVINQSYTNLEIILVNDGSTDENSLSIAKEYTLKDKRITLFDKKNGGQSSARNVGIEYFSGEYKLKNKTQTIKENSLIEFNLEDNNPYEIYTVYKSYKAFNDKKDLINFTYPNVDYIIFLDPDDYWRLDAVEQCVIRCKNVDLVWFDYKMFYDNIDKQYYENVENLTKTQMQIYEYFAPEIINVQQWLERMIKIQSTLPFWCVCAACYSFSYLKRIQLKFLDGFIHEDVHFGILSFIQAENIYIFPSQLYYYRIRSSSTAAYDKKVAKENITPYIEDLCGNFNGDIKKAKHYHAKSSNFFNAFYIREFIKNKLDDKKGQMLEEAIFMYLYFWHFDLRDFEKDPRDTLKFLSNHKPLYQENQDRYPEYDFICKYGFARDRIQKQLTYRLGKLVLEKSQNFFGLVFLPYFIFKLILKFKNEKKEYQKLIKKTPELSLPKLELYPDFDDIWKVREHLSFKIGHLILKANKNWYKGSYIYLPYYIYKCYKQHQNSKKNISTYIHSQEILSKRQFVWKDESLVNIALNKQVFQSSIDELDYRHNPNMIVSQDYSGVKSHKTCFTNWPWFVVDLYESYMIEKVRIVNIENHFKRKYLKGMDISFSIDGIHWTAISREKFYWKYNDYYCELVLSECLSARYVKISIERGALELSKIEIFSRNKNGYIISSKPDGLGMRLASILVGMYLAKKCNFNFGFTWSNSIDLAFMGITDSQNTKEINYLGNAMDEVDAVFNLDFIKEYLIDSACVNENHGMEIRKKNSTFEQIQDKTNFETEWGWYSTDILPSNWLNECVEKECLKEISRIYSTIGFSDGFKKIIQDSRVVKINKFVALHIRGGDIIFSKIRKAPGWNVVQERYFPYEIALDIVTKELASGYSIIVFGQDLNANKALVEYFQKIAFEKIFLVDEFIDKTYNEMERSFFEINLMSRAEKIYSAKESVFSKVAMMIAGKNNLISYHDIYTQKDQADIIQANLSKITLHNFQDARAYFRLFELFRDRDIKKSMSFLNKALELDYDNDAYRIYILDCLFKLKDYHTADTMLEKIIAERYEDFFSTLLQYSMGSFTMEYELYKDFKQKEYPNILYVAFKIFMFFGDIKKADYVRFHLLEDKLSIFKKKSRSNEKNIGAVARVKCHLSYSLGVEFIRNKNKFYKIPICIYKVIGKYRKERMVWKNYNYPSLETYSDYQDALRIKNQLSYKIGNLLIQSYKKWYKGAFLILPWKFYFLVKQYKKGK
ncbi:glycosyltransferase [Campylobacter coli]|uniref:glycosyltransferase n=2 Tax=Campylobacter coli TaxID=195 RepID=UPI001CCCE50A|nr:glycosyltransferase [Campylobacter coli]MCE7228842.1 glycosyltransferase [Campylobacter coli]UQE05711.1 glycosyltransferase [Campylobacter coli]